MNDKTKILVATILGAALIVGAFLAVPAVLNAASSDGASEPSPTSPATGHIGQATAAPTLDRTGQAVGDFDPLIVPDGVDFGEGVKVSYDQLTPGGSSAELGETLVVAKGDVEFLVSVDSVGDIYSDADMNALIADHGIDWGYPGLGVTVQPITMRVRHIGGTGDAATFDIASAIELVGTTGSDMVVMQNAACPGPRTPFDGHDVRTGDTVQVCLLAVGGVGAPAATLASIDVAGITVEAPALIVEGHED